MPKIFLAFLLILLLPLMGCSSKDEVSKDDIDISYLKEESQRVKEYTYEQISHMEINSPFEMKGRMWVKNKQARGENILATQKGQIIEIQGFIFNDGVGIIDKYEIKYEYQDEIHGRPAFLAAYREDIVDIREHTFLIYMDKLDPKRAKIIDFVSYNGQECVVIEPNFVGEEMIEKMWVSLEHFVPVKIANEMISIEFTNIEVGKGTVKNNTLKIPKDATLIH